MKQLVLVLALCAAGLVALGAGLRPDAFYAGDPGVKLIAARAALAHPLSPFDIPLPTIGTDVVPSVEPFFSVHGEHRHAVTSPLFPSVSALLLGAFGIRGLYLLPGLGFLLAIAGCGRLATALDRRRSEALTAAIAALATPFLFYGLEFWEHMPAVGCAVAATALLLRGRALGGGLLMGVAVLLRPEAAWFGVAVLVAAPFAPERPDPRALATAVAAAVIATTPYAIYTFVHFGALLPMHIGVNATSLGVGWLAARVAIADLWFSPGPGANIWRVAPVVVCALVSLGTTAERKGRAFLWLVAAIDALLVVATAPNDGGAQWGPRYLLFAFAPLTVLTGDMVQALPRRRMTTAVLLVAVALGCAWVQRAAYRQLQGTKVFYGRVVDFVAAETLGATPIVTNLWWLDQIAANAVGDRQVFYAPEASTGQGILGRMSNAAVPSVAVISSTSESADPTGWTEGTCYVEERRRSIAIRDLVLVRLRHRCP